jgi:hypothetical protein
MTLFDLATRAIHSTMRREQLSVERAFQDPRIAAWVVWELRGKSPMLDDERKTLNRCRRALQRNGFIRI